MSAVVHLSDTEILSFASQADCWGVRFEAVRQPGHVKVLAPLGEAPPYADELRPEDLRCERDVLDRLWAPGTWIARDATLRVAGHAGALVEIMDPRGPTISRRFTVISVEVVQQGGGGGGDPLPL